jgi:PAS domain S-box-containing protein
MTTDMLHWQRQSRTLEILSVLSYRNDNLKSYLQQIVLGVREIIGLDWTVVTLCRDGYERVVASTIEMEDSEDEVYSFHGTLTGTVVEQGCSLVVEDTECNPKAGEAPEGYRAYLGVPLRTSAGEVIGTVCSFNHQPRQFAPEEVQLVELFAERAATALDNYLLYEQQQQLNAQLQVEIRERKQMAEALRESEEQLRQIAENMDQILWLYTHNQHCDRSQPIYINSAFECIWGQPRAAWYTNPNIWVDSIHPDDRDRVVTAFNQAATTKFNEEYRIIRADGSVRIIQDQAFPIRDESGRVYRLAGIAEDITERKQAEQERLKAIASLAEVGELAAMIVHEVRNPLTTILMGLNSFKRMDLSSSAKERLELALQEAERLRQLLNEILLYAKPQALNCSALELNQFITELLGPIRTMPSAMQRHIKFIPAPHSITIWGDRDKLKQVFINLIDNACEAIDVDEIVTWTIEPTSTKEHVYVRVHNGGPSIPPDIIPKLTKPFYTTKSCGTGLGLAIVKRIIDTHAGELTIDSSSERGTTISVKLAIAAQQFSF